MSRVSILTNVMVLGFLLLASTTSCQVTFNETGFISENGTYENIRIFGNDLYAINHEMWQLERHNLKTGEVTKFSTGKIVESRNAATDYDIYKDKVYIFSTLNSLIDVFTYKGKYLESFETPIKHHTSLNVIGEDEFISVNAMYSGADWLRPRDATICKFNRKGVIAKRTFPLPEPEKGISVAILLGPKREKDKFVFYFTTIPSRMEMEMDISKIRLDDYDFPPLLKAFEKQMSVSSKGTRVIKDYKAVLGVESINEKYDLVLNAYQSDYKFVLTKKNGEPIEGTEVKIDKVQYRNRPFSVYKKDGEAIIFYCLYKQDGIRYFKLKLPANEDLKLK